jgi:hypothetical protein
LTSRGYRFAVPIISRCTILRVIISWTLLPGGTRRNGVACKQAKLYATGGFWRHDPGLQILWNREADGRPIIAHMYIDHI